MSWLFSTVSLRKKKNAPLGKRRISLEVELLENRIVPVVGNQFFPPPLTPAAPGTPNAIYDGVVRITNNVFIGSGTLLNDGLHVLTAAHVLAGITGNLLANNQTVTFQLARTDGPGGAANPIYRNININVPVASQIVYPSYGPVFPFPNDIGVVTLPPQPGVVAPANDAMVAPYYGTQIGFSPYDGVPGSEVGQQYTVVGYGLTGTGLTGAISDTGGTKRLGYNIFDTPSSTLNNQVQTIGLTTPVVGAAGGGTFTLSFTPPGAAIQVVTPDIAWNAPAQPTAGFPTSVQTILRNALGNNNVTVTDGPGGPTAPGQTTTWFISFGGTWANTFLGQVTMNGAALVGRAPAPISIRYPGGSNQLQSFTVTGATNDSYELIYNPPTLVAPFQQAPWRTAPIQWNATANTVQSALNALEPLTGNVQVTAGAAVGQYIVTFINQLANYNVNPLTVAVGGTATVTNPVITSQATANAAGFGKLAYDFNSGQPQNDALNLFYGINSPAVTTMDEVQRVTLPSATGGNATGGNFALTYTPLQGSAGALQPPATTGPINWNADAAVVLQTLNNATDANGNTPLNGNLTVANAPGGGWDITFINALGGNNLNLLSVDAQQTLTLNNPIAGPYTLGLTLPNTVNGGVTITTAPIPINATAAMIQTALESAQPPGGVGIPPLQGNVQVSGSPGTFFNVTFLNQLANITVNPLAITPPAAGIINGNLVQGGATNLVPASTCVNVTYQTMGKSEDFDSHGDSGGPGLVTNSGQLQIAGVVSGGARYPGVVPAVLGPNGDGFGEIGLMTQVSAYNASFIQPIMNAQHGVLLDMNYQMLGVDGTHDPITITASKTNAGNLQLVVEDLLSKQYSGTYFTGAAANITSLTLVGAIGQNTYFYINGNLGVGPITIFGGAGAVNRVYYLGGANQSNTTYTVTGVAGFTTLNTSTPQQALQPPLLQTIAADTNIQSFWIRGDGTNLFNVQSTLASTAVAIETTTGINNVNVGSTLDNTSTLANIAGQVWVYGNASATTNLNVNDQGGPQMGVYTITNNTVVRTNATINYDSLVTHLRIHTSSIATTYVRSTSISTSIVSPPRSNSTVFVGRLVVGNAYNLDGVLGNVNVVNADQLIINDLAGSIGTTYNNGAFQRQRDMYWVGTLVTRRPGNFPGIGRISYETLNAADISPAPAVGGGAGGGAPLPGIFFVQANTTNTTINTDGPDDVVNFDLTGPLANLVSINNNLGLATVQFQQGVVASNFVTFLPDTDLSAIGGSFDVVSPVTAADAYVSAGNLTVEASQTLAVTGNVGLTGGTTHVAGGIISDSGNFTQSGPDVLSLDLGYAATPVVVSGTIALSGILQLNPVSGFNPSPYTEITLIHNAASSTSPVVGQFQGLPEGSAITVGNLNYIISYKGGTNGQDVVLTVGGPPSSGAPIANYFTVLMGQGQTANINLVANAYSSTGAPLVASIVSPPTQGSVVYNATTGLFDYTPTSSSYTGPDSFTYLVNDGTQDSNTATVAIAVNPINHAPMGANNTVFMSSGNSYTFAAADFGFTDPNDSPANQFSAVEITTLPGVGTLTDNGIAVNAGDFITISDILSNLLVFTPVVSTSSSTSTSFTFQVQDDGGTAYGGIDTDPTPRTMTIDYSQTPTVTSAASATFTVGSAGSFTTTASGFPAATWTATGALPSGLSFTNNGNGTATLSGTPATGSGGIYNLTFVANNGVGSAASQSFTLTINEAAAITSANNTTFTVGSAGTFNVTASGFPASTWLEYGDLPDGLSFTDNGDGTATLSGTPAVGDGGTYTFILTADNGLGSTATQSLTLTVNEPAAITSPNATAFPVGSATAFTATASGFPAATWTESGTLPSGVSFTDNGDGTAKLSGTPAIGSDGIYTFTLMAGNGLGSTASQSFTLTVYEAVAITNTDNTTFTVGSSGTFTATANGLPAPTWTETGALPSGVILTDNGDGTATLSGTPASGSGGIYDFTLSADNGFSTDAQSFILTVNEPATITSPNATAFPVGSATAFTATASGFPAATWTESGTLPSGVSFTDNGDGTAKLSGTPAIGSDGIYTFTLMADNGLGSTASQSFTLTVYEAVAITNTDNTTFTVGSSGTFTATANGLPAPTWTETGALPSGVILTDNGDGTATLSGTPASGSGGIYDFTLSADNGFSCDAQSFTLTVNEAAAITSASSTTFTVGSAGSFTAKASGFPAATWTVTGTLPSGVSFTDNGNGTATLSGTPQVGSGGIYTLTLTASNGVSNDATQTFILTINEPPTIISASSTTFYVGQMGSFTFATDGFPAPSFVILTGTLPKGVTFTDNGDGTATLSGTPAAGTEGTYSLVIEATNSSGNDILKYFTLTIAEMY